MSKPHCHIPFGPDGAGTFSKSFKGYYDVINNVVPLVLEALGKVPFSSSEGRPFTICDYGAADGGTSLNLIAECINWLKTRYGSDQAISIIYEDQPVNDFKSLFMILHDLLPGFHSYYTQYPGVYVSAVGTSFYSQCVPDNSVHLGFSSTAIHWLSKRPVLLEDAIMYCYTQNNEHKQMFADQAAKDWELFLLHRAKELTIGARLLIAGICIDKDDFSTGCKSASAKESMFDQMMQCWCEMEAEGQIKLEEKQNLQFETYHRTEEEFRAPFHPGCKVHDAGLRLVSYKTHITRCPNHTKWLIDGNKDDPEASRNYAKVFISFCRIWSYTTVLMALGDHRSTEEKKQIADEFYAKYEARVAAAPGDHSHDLVHAYMEIEKIGLL